MTGLSGFLDRGLMLLEPVVEMSAGFTNVRGLATTIGYAVHAITHVEEGAFVFGTDQEASQGVHWLHSTVDVMALEDASVNFCARNAPLYASATTFMSSSGLNNHQRTLKCVVSDLVEFRHW